MTTATELRAWRFDELVAEGVSLIPAHAPGWTNHNPSDPGITLVELLAYVTEALAWRLGRVPPAGKLQFLRLLKGPHWTGWRDLADADGETMDHALAQAVRALGQQACAVTAADFEALAAEAAQRVLGAPVRALCIPGIDLSAAGRPEGVNESGVPERAAETAPIKAQSAAIAGAMASICNAEWGCLGGTSGHGGFVHTLSDPASVSVVLLPQRDLPAAAVARLCDTVREHLKPHGLLGTRLHVVGPVMLHAGIGVRVALSAGAHAAAVRTAVEAALRRHWGPWPDEPPGDEAAPPGTPLRLLDLTELIDGVDGVDHVEAVHVLALAHRERELQDPAFRIGLQIGVHATPGVDAWLGASVRLGSGRLVRDAGGRLVSLQLQPWEVLRLQLMPGAFHTGDVDVA